RSAGEGLIGAGTLGCGKQTRSAPQRAALPMPLVDVVGERTKASAEGGRDERIISRFDHLLGVEAHSAAKIIGQHLRAEADAENGLPCFSATPIHSVSLPMNASLSLALIGPPKITAPQ